MTHQSVEQTEFNVVRGMGFVVLSQGCNHTLSALSVLFLQRLLWLLLKLQLI